MFFKSGADFKNTQNKAVTLMGMSGVGKTFISQMLSKKGDWFHYSVDYRIGTAYMRDDLSKYTTAEAAKNPLLKEFIDNGSVLIENNLSIENLSLLSAYLGKIGNAAKGGLSLEEFKRRQNIYMESEKKSTIEAASVMELVFDSGKSDEKENESGNNFLVDSTGSLCEIINVDNMKTDKVLKSVCDNTLLLYIKASDEHVQTLTERAAKYPKPLLYKESFLDEQIAEFMQKNAISTPEDINPDEFVRYVFEKLLQHRIPRYETIADNYGYTVDATDMSEVKNQDDFVDLIAEVIDKK